MIKLRRALYAVWLYGGTFLLMTLYLPLLFVPRAGIREALKFWARVMIFGMRYIAGVRLDIRGIERLPKGSYILACKHQSMFDVVPPYFVAHDMLYVMKKELGRVPLFGWLSLKAKMIRVDREAHAQALRQLIADARMLMAETRQLLIFPEGTRHPPGSPPEYKPGVAALYKELDVPCVPVATNSGVYLDAAANVMKRGTVVWEILEPIPPGLKRAEFMRVLQERIETASTALLTE